MLTGSASSAAAVICVCVGVYFLVQREWVARSPLQRDFLAFGLRMDPKWYERAFVVWGVLFIAIGLLAMSGVVRLEPILAPLV